MVLKVSPYVRASRSWQPIYPQQWDFGGLNDQEYYPYMAEYYSPQYGYYCYYPQYLQPITEEATSPTNGRAEGLHRGTQPASPAAPTAGTLKAEPRTKDGRNDDKKQHEDGALTNERISHLRTHIKLLEQVVLPILDDEAWNYYDMVEEADSKEEDIALKIGIMALAITIEVMESAKDFGREQMRELLHPGESECSCDDDEEDHSFLNFLLTTGFLGNGQDSRAGPGKYGQETHAARPTGYATRKTAAVGREGRSRPRRNKRAPETSSYREV